MVILLEILTLEINSSNKNNALYYIPYRYPKRVSDLRVCGLYRGHVPQREHPQHCLLKK